MPRQQLQSQIGFYLLPPEYQVNPVDNNNNSSKKRGKQASSLLYLSTEDLDSWRAKNQLDVIAEASDESRANSARKLDQGEEAHHEQDAEEDSDHQLSITNISPKLLRKHTAYPGQMFDRPTRHPSLDDLRGYGRKGRQQNQRYSNTRTTGSDDLTTSGGAESGSEVVKLPAIAMDRRTDVETDFSKCQHPQSRICRNLRYSLYKLKIRGLNELYRSILEAIVVGPSEVDSLDVEEVLGVRSKDFLRSKFKRNELESPGNQPKFETNNFYSNNPGNKEPVDVVSPSPPDPAVVSALPKEIGSRSRKSRKEEPRRGHRRHQEASDIQIRIEKPKEDLEDDEEEDLGRRERENPESSKNVEEEYHTFGGFSKTKSSYKFEENSLPARKYSLLMSRPGLRKQFERFAKFGESRASGDFITLAQSDKWLKQAGIIDHWNVTVNDTGYFFNKISKGSRWLDYDEWRILLEELAWRKRLNIAYLVDKLEFSGHPSNFGGNF